MCISKRVKLLSRKNEFKIFCGLISFVIHKEVALLMGKTKIKEKLESGNNFTQVGNANIQLQQRGLAHMCCARQEIEKDIILNFTHINQ